MNTHQSLLLTLIITMAALLASCGASAREYNDVSQAGTLSQKLCFRVEHLPADFEVVAKLMRNNAAAAQDFPDPQQRERDYADWGRVVGSFQHWAFEPPSMPDEDADGRMSDEEIEKELEAARQELLEASFRSATCRVDVYRTSSGAERAFLGELRDLENPTHLLHVTVLEASEYPTAEDGSLVVQQYTAPEVTRFIVLMRVDNLIGEVSVSSNCDVDSGQECASVRERASSLAALLHQSLVAATDSSDTHSADPQAAPAADHSSVRDAARMYCAARDFSGCVDQYVNHVDARDHVALCRSEYGGWFFEEPVGQVGDLCSDDHYIITAILGFEK